ncbi:MAG TPA: PilW family protein [Steroidobacteraceae bacterium]|nr:PilW family protein [Steroidobacteraceae bacterium]
MKHSNLQTRSAGMRASHLVYRRERGFTLVELMVAITIAVFLLGGLLTTVQSTRRAFGDQNQLAQLQDNQRLAMTLMAAVIETAGYYPDPTNNSNTAVMPAGGVFATAGQPIFGVSNASAAGDTVTIRYGAGLNAGVNGDNVLNCLGTTNTTVAPYDTFVNQFSVANNQLTCTLTTSAGAQAPVALVNNVKSLGVVYGVKRNGADTGSCTDTYLQANQMAATDWTAVCSVTVTLTFVNPLAPTGPGIVIQRVIAVMNQAGVNT